MSRTADNLVRAAIDSDAALDLSVFIEIASSLVDEVESNDSDSILDAKRLRSIETMLACHFYAHRDQQLASEKTEDASGKYQGEFGMGFNSTQWGQSAMMLDSTGYLARLNRRAEHGTVTPQFFQLGKAPSEQTDYIDRD